MATTKIKSGAIADGAVHSSSLDSSVIDTINDVTIDTVFTGDSITIPAGDTATRPGTPVAGMVRYNTETGLVEQYNSAGWQGIDTPPSIIGIAGIVNEDTDSTITVTGLNFKTGAIIYIEGDAVGGISRPLTTSFISTNELQANTNASLQPFVGGAAFSVKVSNISGLSGILDPAGNVDRDPIWTTNSGNIATFEDNLGPDSVTVSATDPDGTSITYSVVSGSLPSGLTIDSNTGTISGDPDQVSYTTTYPFVLAAASNTQSVNRDFNIIINKTIDGSTSDRAASSAEAIYNLSTDFQGSGANGTYWINWGGVARQIHCEMGLHGGGWMMILNYNHLGGTNPALNVRTSDFPLMGQEYNLGYDESGSSTWGHASNALLNAGSFSKMMWYGKTSFHSRVIHFVTTAPTAISYSKSGTGSMHNDLVNPSYTYNGSLRNSSTIPLDILASDINGYANQNDYALTEFTIYGDSNIGNPRAHWGIRGSGDRWEVDDYPSSQGASSSYADSTIHRIWVK